MKKATWFCSRRGATIKLDTFTKLKSIFVQAAVILVSSSLLSACSEETKQAPAPLVAVIVSTAQQETIKPSSEFVGRAESTDDIKISSRVGGAIVKRFFKQGQHIEKDDPLFEIDKAPYITALNEQKAAYNKTVADFKIANRNYTRGKKLLVKNYISELDMDKLSNLVAAAKSAKNQAQAGVDTANLNLGYTDISAPLDGRVGKSYFAIGDVISPASDTLTTLVKMDPMYVSFQVSEKEMVSFYQEVIELKKKNALPEERHFIVELRLSNGTRYSEQGTIDYVSNRIDPTTGTMNIRALFKNPDDILLPGQYMDVILMSKDTASAILIPQAAVQEDQQGKFVMTVGEGNKVANTRVEMGKRYGLKWEVTKGLKEGDRVIVEGLQKVRSGLEVSATEQEIKPFETDK